MKLIEKAFHFCVENHSNVYRKSGLPFYTHPINVALVLMEEFPLFDTQSIAVCLLHDTIEDVESIEKIDIKREFGEEIAEMVDAVTKISHEEISKSKNSASTYRKLFLALVKDVRVILIKLADRLHNIRTLHYLKENRQKDIALETLSFYTPFAHRLGLTKIKNELENLSFYYYDRNTYQTIRTSLTEKRKDFLSYIQDFLNTIENSLDEYNIAHTLTIIHKHEYELYNMMQGGKSIDDIDNFYSVVIILHSNDDSECYKVHGILAKAFNAISMVDYIANPTLDWYKSLHSELYGPDGKKIEILIRTKEMEKISEDGFASQFSFNIGRTRGLQFTDKEIEDWGQWMQEIIESNETNASKIIWDSVKVNLFDTDLTAFSKDGLPVNLPQGATVLDFAFALSVETALHSLSSKVNGVVKNIDYKLKNGEQIDIIYSPSVSPSSSWNSIVITQRAVVALYNYFKQFPLELVEGGGKHYFDVDLKITGEDREGMLQKITQVVDKNNMKHIALNSKGNEFFGTVTLLVENKRELNLLFVKLLNISGINAVEKL